MDGGADVEGVEKERKMKKKTGGNGKKQNWNRYGKKQEASIIHQPGVACMEDMEMEG